MTSVSKRRQQTSRLEAKVEVIEPRNPYNGKVNAVTRAEDNIAWVVIGKT